MRYLFFKLIQYTVESSHKFKFQTKCIFWMNVYLFNFVMCIFHYWGKYFQDKRIIYLVTIVQKYVIHLDELFPKLQVFRRWNFKTCSPVFATGVLSCPAFSIMLKQMAATSLIHCASEYENFLALQEHPFVAGDWMDSLNPSRHVGPLQTSHYIIRTNWCFSLELN